MNYMFIYEHPDSNYILAREKKTGDVAFFPPRTQKVGEVVVEIPVAKERLRKRL